MSRTTPGSGATALADPNQIKLFYNAEIRPPPKCCTGGQLAECLACPCDFFTDTKKSALTCFWCIKFPFAFCAKLCCKRGPYRSYLYLREGAMETNDSVTDPITCSFADNVDVTFFDAAPFASSGCLCPDTPKLDVVKIGCVCCCIEFPCDKEAVLMPYETKGCVRNRSGWCSNFCGLCGPITGTPIKFDKIYPQPTNPDEFAEIGGKLLKEYQMNRGNERALVERR